MKNGYFLFVLLVGLTLSSTNLMAQIQIFGQVAGGNQEIPLEYATVVLLENESDKLIAGTTTDSDGSFTLQTDHQDFYLEISFIGYASTTIKSLDVVNGKIALGNILLTDDSQTLSEVVVRAEKSQTEFKLDKRVFNVGKDLSSTGASVLEVLNNVPSVNVNIEGDISLRGSTGVQILINGKPSVIASEQGNALGTITAEMIDRIEVITNPSAKYDAEGTSGIINIVIKKEERKGVNGSFTINTGTPHNHSFGLSLNRRTEKFNLFSQVGVGYRELPSDNENLNRNLNNNTSIASYGTDYRNENFYNVILGTDYHIDRFNVITLSGNFAYEIEDQPSLTTFTLTDGLNNQVSQWSREETTHATNPKWQYELQYKRDFQDDEDHQLLFSALGNFFGKDQSSEFIEQAITEDAPLTNQEIQTNFKESEYTFKLDYTKPVSEEFTFETGAQYVINDVSNDYAVDDLVDGDWINNPNLTNLFNYNQKVLGAYGTAAYEGEVWGLKLGLRMEHTDLNTLLVTTGQANQQNFVNLFPTAHTSYKISDKVSLQAGYSRRIFRPRLWDLNPFFNIRNNFNIRTGNPDLMPEYTDSYEITSIFVTNKASFNFGVYHRYTTEVVERISTFEDNVTTFKPINVGTNRSTGIEFNTKYTPGKWITIMGDFNFNYFTRQGSLDEFSFDFTGEQWSSKLTSKFKLPADIDFEITGHYRSRFQTVQSLVSGNVFADLGLRKKIMNGKAVINLSVRDIFASRFRESIIDQVDFYTYRRSQRGRFVTVGFSYGFGKGEAMEFSGSRRRH